MNKSGQMLSQMLSLATTAHAGQFDKGGKPYILHPLKVMHYLQSDDEELQCIALGHDLIEDTWVTEQMLYANGMSTRVVEGIVALTKVEGQSFAEYKDKVKSNPDAVRVKMCDLRHNTDVRRLKGLTEKDFERMQRYSVFYSELKAIV
jgi:(p)ppGpp synthase/HD superfamily hydrolase